MPARVLCSKLLLYRSGQPDEPRSSSSQTAAGLTAIPPATHQPDNHRDQINQPPSPIQPITHQPGAALIQTSPSSFTPVIPFVTQRPVSEGLAGWHLAGWLTPRPCTHALAREFPPAPRAAPRVVSRIALPLC